MNIKFIYSVIGLSEGETKDLRKTIEKYGCYVIASHDTPYDRFFKSGIEKWGTKYKLGIPCAFNYDTSVLGDYICNIYWPEEHWEKWRERNLKTKSIEHIDMEQLLYLMHERPTKIKVVVYKDAEAAEQIRQNTLKYFKEAKK